MTAAWLAPVQTSFIDKNYAVVVKLPTTLFISLPPCITQPESIQTLHWIIHQEPINLPLLLIAALTPSSNWPWYLFQLSLTSHTASALSPHTMLFWFWCCLHTNMCSDHSAVVSVIVVRLWCNAAFAIFRKRQILAPCFVLNAGNIIANTPTALSNQREMLPHILTVRPWTHNWLTDSSSATCYDTAATP